MHEATLRGTDEDSEPAQAYVSALKMSTAVPRNRVSVAVSAALKRRAEIDARRINGSIEDSKAMLTGNVHSWTEREAAERAVWSAPGVAQVDDRITVVP